MLYARLLNIDHERLVLHRNTSSIVWESQLKMACCRLQRRENLLDPLSYSDMERRNRRGWSCWRSPAETLSINGPRKPPPFSFKSLFFSPYVSIRKSISHPSAELNRGKKSNKKYPSRHRQEGGKMGDIESFFFWERIREKIENWRMYLIEMLSNIFCFFGGSSIILQSPRAKKSRKKRSNVSSMTDLAI